MPSIKNIVSKARNLIHASAYDAGHAGDQLREFEKLKARLGRLFNEATAAGDAGKAARVKTKMMELDSAMSEMHKEMGQMKNTSNPVSEAVDSASPFMAPLAAGAGSLGLGYLVNRLSEPDVSSRFKVAEWVDGFVEKCAEHGVDGAALLDRETDSLIKDGQAGRALLGGLRNIGKFTGAMTGEMFPLTRKAVRGAVHNPILGSVARHLKRNWLPYTVLAPFAPAVYDAAIGRRTPLPESESAVKDVETAVEAKKDQAAARLFLEREDAPEVVKSYYKNLIASKRKKGPRRNDLVLHHYLGTKLPDQATWDVDIEDELGLKEQAMKTKRMKDEIEQNYIRNNPNPLPSGLTKNQSAIEIPGLSEALGRYNAGRK